MSASNSTTPSSTPNTSPSTTPITTPSDTTTSTTISTTSTPSTSPSSTSTITSTSTKPSSTTTVTSSTRPAKTTTSLSVISSTSGTVTTPHTTTVVITSPGSTVVHTLTPSSSGSSTSTSSPSPLVSGGQHNSSSHGLSTGATTAIAVVIPVVAVAVLLGLGIWFWRRRKQKQTAAEERRKEVEDYGFNPNQDPHLPVVAADGAQMTEDHNSGYRGWGTTTASNRKASTTLSGGHTQHFSDADNSYVGGPSSPGFGYADGHNDQQLNNDELGVLGAGPVSRSQGNVPIKRGTSNASSAYSAGGRSDHSDEPPPVPGSIGQAFDYTPTQGYGYSQHGPYGDGTYGGGQDGGMPVVQDVSARRNTRIQPGGAYQQGNSGIAQNF